MILLKRLLLALLKATSIHFIVCSIQQFIGNNLDYSSLGNSDLKPEPLPDITLKILNRQLKIPKRLADLLTVFANAKKLGPGMALFSFIHSLIFDFGLFEALIIELSRIANQTCKLPEKVPEISSTSLTIAVVDQFLDPAVDQVLDSIWKTGVYNDKEQQFLGSEIKIKLINSIDGIDGIDEFENLQNCTKSILIITFLLKWIRRFNPQKFKSLLKLLLELLKKGKLSKKAIRLLARFLQSKGLPIDDLLDFLD